MTAKKTGPLEVSGRPTKYDPKYCMMLIKHMASGLSYESFAGVLEVSRAVLYDWEKVHPSFLDAKKIGSERNLLFWENAGQEGLWDKTEYDEETGKPKFKKTLNSTVWIFSMKNRHKWRDKHEIDATIKDDTEREKIRKMSMKELEEFVRENLDKNETKE